MWLRRAKAADLAGIGGIAAGNIGDAAVPVKRIKRMIGGFRRG
jgi:hypothetical protein